MADSYFKSWYAENREDFLQRRRKRYQEDKIYRERQQRYTQESRLRKKKGEPLVHLNTLNDLAESLDVCTGTLRYWFKQGYMPVPPKGESGRYSISDEALLLLTESFKAIGGRLKPSNINEFKEVKTKLIALGWKDEIL